MTETERPRPRPRADFALFMPIQTRWSDNDAYGHVNNVVYYSWFDSVVNRFLIERGALDIAASEVIGLVVETRCSYFSSLAFPQSIEAGLRVAHIGKSSVRYEIGIFAAQAPMCSAIGHFVHVYVERASSTPVALPQTLKEVLQEIAQ